MTRQGDLIGCPVHQPGAGQLLHQVRVVLGHQGDAMLQPLAGRLYLGQLLLADTELGLGVFQGQNAAIAPDGVGPEVADDRHRDRWQDQNGEKARDRTLDSHPLTESQSDSAGQDKMRKGFKELTASRIKLGTGIL